MNFAGKKVCKVHDNDNNDLNTFVLSYYYIDDTDYII